MTLRERLHMPAFPGFQAKLAAKRFAAQAKVAKLDVNPGAA